MLPSHNFTRFHRDRYAISGRDQCPWKKLSDSDKLGAKIGDPGKVILDCRAKRTLYKDLRLPSPKMYLAKWEDCQVACDDSDDCEAYSYKKDTSPPGGCWLFGTLKYGTRIPDDEAVTGRKWCQISSLVLQRADIGDFYFLQRIRFLGIVCSWSIRCHFMLELVS